MMPLRWCIVCTAEASSDLQLQYCAVCKSALYCSETCQKTDWKMQHKKICKLLNVGHGDMQVRSILHTSKSIASKERFESVQRSFNEDIKLFFKLFKESTFEGSRAAARKMKKIAERQTKRNQKFMLFHSLRILVLSNSKMLSWPNSPILVLVEFVDPSMLTGDDDEPLQEGEARATPLHHLANLADPFDYSTHESQLILAKQLIEHGANVNAVSSDGTTPLHSACSEGNVTNLDFIKLLLEGGADPNAKDHFGETPLILTTSDAPGAAKFLLNWPTTDLNIAAPDHVRFRHLLAMNIDDCSDQIRLPDIPDQVQQQFLLQQWCEIEEMLVEGGIV
jgi:hypothetical protein